MKPWNLVFALAAALACATTAQAQVPPTAAELAAIRTNIDPNRILLRA